MKQTLPFALAAVRSLTNCSKATGLSSSATVVRILLAILLLAIHLPTMAQTPVWQSARAIAAATTTGGGGSSLVTATAIDAAGSVFLAGYFTNNVVLGSTTLTSRGSNDVFVAKFNPSTNQFVWAQQAGGTGDDRATALAVSGTSVYVAGAFASLTATFGPAALTNMGREDVFVAKLTDAGSAGGFAWAQQAGGTGVDQATALATSGTSVYVAGNLISTTADFGTTTLSTVNGLEVFVAKLTDVGSTGSFAWVQQAGGRGIDEVKALAVSGINVYMAGSYSSMAIFGAITLTTVGSADVFVAKLTDAGSTGSFVWAQRAGGTGYDEATALAARGNTVYIAGSFESLAANFGPATLTTVGAADVFVAKLTDAGSAGGFVWARRAGGTGYDVATALALKGTGVYVAGCFYSPSADFGTTTLTTVGSADVFVANLTDASSMGSFEWAQLAGGISEDRATALSVSSTSIYVGGYFYSAAAAFGSITLANPNPNRSLGFLASLPDATPTATATGRALVTVQLFPNPARYTATLRLPVGTAPAPLTLTDAQGRTIRQYPAPASTETTLDLRSLPAGLYLLRGAGIVQRLAVE